jgi:hypothetical protein
VGPGDARCCWSRAPTGARRRHSSSRPRTPRALDVRSTAFTCLVNYDGFSTRQTLWCRDWASALPRRALTAVRRARLRAGKSCARQVDVEERTASVRSTHLTQRYALGGEATTSSRSSIVIASIRNTALPPQTLLLACSGPSTTGERRLPLGRSNATRSARAKMTKS